MPPLGGIPTHTHREIDMRICIITDRLPQPDRHRGAILDVSPEKGASLIAQGFAKAIEDTAPKAAPAAAEPATAPAAAAPARRIRTGDAL